MKTCVYCSYHRSKEFFKCPSCGSFNPMVMGRRYKSSVHMASTVAGRKICPWCGSGMVEHSQRDGRWINITHYTCHRCSHYETPGQAGFHRFPLMKPVRLCINECGGTMFSTKYLMNRAGKNDIAVECEGCGAKVIYHTASEDWSRAPGGRAEGGVLKRDDPHLAGRMRATTPVPATPSWYNAEEIRAGVNFLERYGLKIPTEIRCEGDCEMSAGLIDVKMNYSPKDVRCVYRCTHCGHNTNKTHREDNANRKKAKQFAKDLRVPTEIRCGKTLAGGGRCRGIARAESVRSTNVEDAGKLVYRCDSCNGMTAGKNYIPSNSDRQTAKKNKKKAIPIDPQVAKARYGQNKFAEETVYPSDIPCEFNKQDTSDNQGTKCTGTMVISETYDHNAATMMVSYKCGSCGCRAAKSFKKQPSFPYEEAPREVATVDSGAGKTIKWTENFKPPKSQPERVKGYMEGESIGGKEETYEQARDRLLKQGGGTRT